MNWASLFEMAARVARSPLAGELVLRGSVPMRLWFGDRARRPGDVDYVVADAYIEAHSPDGDAIMDGLTRVLGPPESESDLWADGEAIGRRLGYPGGRIDVVFGEILWAEPEILPVNGVPVPAASPTLELAWKLRWLEGGHPEPKDLYDAVLLAESPRVDLELSRGVFEAVWRDDFVELPPRWSEHAPADDRWRAAGLPGRPGEWIDRLNAACGLE
ncbi:hypothetical protein Afil01_60200 [Actinorhabdospora filicis]|uniref:Nucleotidyl transferase AbiEii toxin, Type IV TA system n=1 Tax=Actinorhabdospora filicis TaxID=1785913 RepID=A0A9W6SRV8_9ACTN|nr:nucleotidyl transferase AbiEii/AbiGii toxin family protein [Actinorhabdospora filicis]GLZ81213.1 hypothetical protein Afil01_60200 [Actinorhabdospora filicis]